MHVATGKSVIVYPPDVARNVAEKQTVLTIPNASYARSTGATGVTAESQVVMFDLPPPAPMHVVTGKEATLYLSFIVRGSPTCTTRRTTMERSGHTSRRHSGK